MPYLLTASPGNPTNWVKMETDTILSGHSNKLASSNYSRRTTTLPKSNLSVSNFPSLPPLPPIPGNLTSLSNYSLSRNINNLNTMNNYHQFSPNNLHYNSSNHMQPMQSYQSAVSVPYNPNVSRLNHHQVNILPTVDDWADNTTAMSVMSDPDLDPAGGQLQMQQPPHIHQETLYFKFHRWAGFSMCVLLSVLSFLSPPIMLILPQMNVFHFRASQLRCDVECDGNLISFSFKMIVLGLGSWGVFFRKPRATLPRIQLYRGLTCLLLLVLGLTFWLFYGVRLMEQRRRIHYKDIVAYSESYVDSLLVLHYLVLLLVHLRPNHNQYLIKILRSPDGESSSFPLGNMSIQAAASAVLDHYYCTFPVFNPYLDQLPVRARKESPNYKYYDVDGHANYGHFVEKDSRVGSPTFRNCKREFGHNDLFYEEYEYERRMKKRRARLITVTEEAFSHIKRVNTDNNKGPSVPMDAYEAAQTIFPSIVRPLQKYLRITRQQPRHTMDSILTHLANIITFDMSPKAFLEKYLVTKPVLQSEREQIPSQFWSLISDVMVSRGIATGTTFLLRQGEMSLLCEVVKMPHYVVTEAARLHDCDKFVINRDPMPTATGRAGSIITGV